MISRVRKEDKMRSKGVTLFVIVIFQLFFTLITQSYEIYEFERYNVPPRRKYLNFTEITLIFDYLSEEHVVETEDGYLLTIFRMLKGKNCKENLRSPPVLLEHGLLLSSDVWLDVGEQQGLPFLLADACYDLWVGNQRGNYYGRKHILFDPDKDTEFWKFSNDEIGYYDIPATIDYILKYTKSPNINYIGFSQGGGAFYIMCSERPEYCQKINLQISLAPATRHLYTKAAGFRKVTIAFHVLKHFLDSTHLVEAFGRDGPTQTIFKNLCENEIAYEICSMAESIFDGYNPGSITPQTQRLIFNHFPAGTSTQNLAKFGQAMFAQDFVKYDYGFHENIKIYKSVEPPAYNFSAVTAPVVVIYGINDGIVDKDDVKWVISKLPNVIKVYEIEHPRWTHFDFTYSNYTEKYLYRKIHKHLKSFKRN